MFIQNIRDEQEARKQRILDNLSGKTKTLTSKEYEFDDDIDLAGYENPYTSANIVYTKEELEQMSHAEFSKHERAINIRKRK